MQTVHLSAPARPPAHGVDVHDDDGERATFAAPRPALSRALAEAKADVYVVNDAAPVPEADLAACLPFGFPCFRRHAFHESPYFGFRGWLWFAQELFHCTRH